MKSSNQSKFRNFRSNQNTTYQDALEIAQNQLKQITDNVHFSVDVFIRNYPHFINRHFASQFSDLPKELCEKAEIPFAFGFYQFGIGIKFKNKTILQLHSTDMELSEPLKIIIENFGLISFENAILDESISDLYHLNNFAHLNFHRDRNDKHENRYSLYTRTPERKEQLSPRTASTLFIDNSVAYLQGRLEGLVKEDEIGRRSHYEIFRTTNLNPLLGKLILDYRWEAPVGQGEIVVINNNSLLHSSYKREGNHGYAIGARYLT